MKTTDEVKFKEIKNQIEKHEDAIYDLKRELRKICCHEHVINRVEKTCQFDVYIEECCDCGATRSNYTEWEWR